MVRSAVDRVHQNVSREKKSCLDLERAPDGPEEREGGEDHPEEDEAGGDDREGQGLFARARCHGGSLPQRRLNSRQVRTSTGDSRMTTPMMVSIEVAAAEPNSASTWPRRSLKISPRQRRRVGLGAEADDRLEDAEIVHQLDQRDEGRQRHQMRDDDEADSLPAARAVDHRRLERVLRHRLQAGVEDDEGEWRVVPDAVDDQRNPGQHRRCFQG